MNKREARCHAIDLAISLLEADVNISNELYDTEFGSDGAKVHDQLEVFIQELREKLNRMQLPPKDKNP